MSAVVVSRDTPAIIKHLQSLGFAPFEKGDWNLNIIAQRIANTSDTNQFDDILTVSYPRSGYWYTWTARCTTDPGRYWVQKSSKGAASLVPGQYRSGWQLGRHKDKYDALVPARPLPVYRDRDRDGKPDKSGPVDLGWFGTNIHRASANGESTTVDQWSAGCIVVASAKDFEEFLRLCQQSARRYGPKFTVTIIEVEAAI